MKTKINEEVDKEIWWVLQEIKKESFATPKDEYVYFEYQLPDSFIPSKEDQRRVLKILEKDGAIKIMSGKYPIPYLSDISAKVLNIKSIGVWLDILQPKFDKLYKKYEKKLLQLNRTGEIKFLDNEAILQLGDKKCQLPSYKNEHFFCRVAFEYPIGEPVDWSEIAEKMDTEIKNRLGQAQTGKEIEKIKRSIYDTVRAINKRVKEVLGIEALFQWKGKTIKRTR